VFVGRLVGIYTAPHAARPLEARTEVRAIEGVGLDADRYATKTGTYSGREGPGRQVTLVEREVVADVNATAGVVLGEHETRRNLVTEGVPLLHLVGLTFRIGEVTFLGVRVAPPCAHLEQLTRSGVRAALENRGGLRAEILAGGTLRIGDEITAVPG
jgi:MOSC domain-containing protein YiiM